MKAQPVQEGVYDESLYKLDEVYFAFGQSGDTFLTYGHYLASRCGHAHHGKFTKGDVFPNCSNCS